MEQHIKDKFGVAKDNKNAKKQFVGINGNTNPDDVLKTMVDKLVKE